MIADTLLISAYSCVKTTFISEMPVAALSTSSHVAILSKMEDRKRSATQDDLAPPTKRQAVNGSRSRDADSDMPWARDLEVCYQRIRLQPVNYRYTQTWLLLAGSPFCQLIALLSWLLLLGANARLASNSMPSLTDECSSRVSDILHNSNPLFMPFRRRFYYIRVG